MKTTRMADELSARLVAVIATVLLVLGCDPDPNPRDQYGDVTLQLQTPDGAYELGGSITFDRVGSPPFSRTELLDGGEESTSVTLLVGTYDVTLEDGWELYRIDGSDAVDVSHAVVSVEIIPNPAVVEVDESTTVTLAFELEDGTIVVFGAGAVLVDVLVDDEGLVCNGCDPGEVCLDEQDGTPTCATLCDPEGNVGAQCGSEAQCLLEYFTETDAGVVPIYVCAAAEPPPDEDDPDAGVPDVACTTGESWETLGVAGFSPGAVGAAAIAFSHANVPHVVTSHVDDFMYQASVHRWTGDVWELVGDPQFSEPGANDPSLAFSSDDTPHVAYGISSPEDVSVMRFNGTTWEHLGDPLAPGTRGTSASIAISSGDAPYLAYGEWEGGTYGVSVKTWDGSDWQYVGDRRFSEPGASYISVALSSTDVPHVAFMDGASGGVTVMHWTGTTWDYVGTPGFSGAAAAHVTFRLSPDDTPYVAFRDESNRGRATVMRYVSGAWEYVGGGGFSSRGALFTSLGIPSTGEPHVAFMDVVASNRASLMGFTEGQWNYFGTQGFSPGLANSTSLAFSQDDVPHVAFIDEPNGYRATVMRGSSVCVPIVVTNVQFPYPEFCDVVSADITNIGDVTLPFGWTITYAIPELGYSQVFDGMQALAPGQTAGFVHGGGEGVRGPYEVVITAGESSASATMACPPPSPLP